MKMKYLTINFIGKIFNKAPIQSIFFKWQTAFLALLVLVILFFAPLNIAFAKKHVVLKAAAAQSNLPVTQTTDSSLPPPFTIDLTQPGAQNTANSSGSTANPADQSATTTVPPLPTDNSSANNQASQNSSTDTSTVNSTNTQPAPMENSGLTMQDLQDYQKSLSQNTKPANPVQSVKNAPKTSTASAKATRSPELAFNFSLPSPQTAAPILKDTASALWAPLVSAWVTNNNPYSYASDRLNPKTTMILYSLSITLFLTGFLFLGRTAKRPQRSIYNLRAGGGQPTLKSVIKNI
jgi:hypothetical protein